MQQTLIARHCARFGGCGRGPTDMNPNKKHRKYKVPPFPRQEKLHDQRPREVKDLGPRAEWREAGSAGPGHVQFLDFVSTTHSPAVESR